MLRTTIGPAVRVLVVMIVVTGLIFPAAVTLAAGLLFPRQAGGSLAVVNGQVVGSTLIGQANQEARYFWPRPSAVNYMDGSTAAAIGVSGASNLGPTSAQLADNLRKNAESFRAANGLAPGSAVPADMKAASASGLDPHISPQAARLQVNRVAAARRLDPQRVMALVEQATERPQLGILGEPRVNVLQLNLALDGLQ